MHHDTPRSRPSHARLLPSLLAAALLLAACGESTPAEDALLEVTETTTSTTTVRADDDVDSTTTSSASDEPGDEQAGGDEQATGEEPADWPDGLPPALPIAEVYEDKNWFWRLAGSDEGLVAVNGIMATVVRDGVMTDVSIQDPALPKVEPIATTAAGSHAVVSSSRAAWQGSILTTIAWDDLEVDTIVDAPGPGTFTYRQAGFDSQAIGLLGGEVGVIDLDTLAISREIGVDWNRAPFAVDDEIWTVYADGSVEAEALESGARLGEGDVGRPLAPFRTWLLGATDDAVYFASSVDTEVVKIDRATMEVETWIDVGDLLPGYSASLIEAEDFHLMLDVEGPAGRWFVLAAFDPEADAIVDSHTVAPNDDRAFRGQFDTAEFAWAQGQLYVQDHQRRIVRVDTDRWGTDTAGWIDPGMNVAAELETPDEIELAGLMVEFLLPEVGGDIPRTDPELSAAMGASVPDSYDPDTPWVGSVDVFGDRAWVLGYLGATAMPFLGFERIDGVWTINSVTECWIFEIARFYTDCPVPEPATTP